MPSKKRPNEEGGETAPKRIKLSPTPIDLKSDTESTHSMSGTRQTKGNTLATLQLLHSDFDALRSLVTCKICERLLYEPYVLSCGHTYCYSCMCTWFQGKKKKTCPNCREVIKQMPAPSYVIKEMTAVFVARAELLPDGETSEQHAQWQSEEAEIVQTDKGNDDVRTGGLFKGCFNGRGGGMGPIIDVEDGVERCPGCNWEIEDGMCNNCGFLIDDDFHIGSGDEISDDVSDEIDGEDVDHDDFDDDDIEPVDRLIYQVPHGVYAFRPPRDPYGYTGEEDDDEDEEEEDEEDDHSMDGFIVDEAEESDAGTPSSSDTGQAPQHARFVHGVPPRPPFQARRRVVVDSDDDDDDDSVTDLTFRRAISRPTAAPITIVDSDDLDSDDSEPPSRATIGRFREHESVSDEEEDEEEDDDEDDDDLGSDAAENGLQAPYNFFPAEPSMDEDEGVYNDESDTEGDPWG